MNDEDLTAFMQHWTSLHDPITTDSAAYHHARTAWQAALSHRDERVAELEAVAATQAKMIQVLRDCEAAEAARSKE